MKKIIILLSAVFMFSCGTFIPYAQIEHSSDFSLQGEKVALLGINIPVDILEKNVALKLMLADDFLKVLKQQNAVVYRLHMPEEKDIQTKIYKNDLYNWFFRSDSYILESDKSKLDLSALDYVIEINVLNYEKGTIKDNDWIEFTILYYSAQDKRLVGSVSGKGFYSSVFKKMRVL